MIIDRFALYYRRGDSSLRDGDQSEERVHRKNTGLV